MCADLECRNLSSGLPPYDGFWDLSEFSVKPSDKRMTEFSSDTDAVLINVGDSGSISELSGCCNCDTVCTDDSVSPEIDGLFDGIHRENVSFGDRKFSSGDNQSQDEPKYAERGSRSEIRRNSESFDLSDESEEELYRIDLGNESEDSTSCGSLHDDRDTELSKLFERLRKRTRLEKAAENTAGRREYVLDSGYTVSVPRAGITRSSDIIRSYESDHPLIGNIEVLRWPSNYTFYEKFRSDAIRYFSAEGHECEYEDFISFVPQYSAMTSAQKEYYFRWRSCLRRGEYIKASKSYVLLLLCEIINLPDLLDPRDGIKLMCELVVHYNENIYGIRRSVSAWIRDYCLIHGVSVPAGYIDAVASYAGNAITLPEFFVKYDPVTKKPDPLSLLNMMSRYSWKDSKYINGENRELFEKYMTEALTAAYDACGDELIPEDDRTQMSKYVSEAYSGAVCTSDVKCRIKLTYRKCDGADEYRYAAGIIKYAENCTRRLLGIKARFKISELPRRATEAVDGYFAPLFEELMLRRKHRKEQNLLRAESIPEYEKLYDAESTGLSFEHALEIEKSSWEITKRLVDAFGNSDGNTAEGSESGSDRSSDKILTSLDGDIYKASETSSGNKLSECYEIESSDSDEHNPFTDSEENMTYKSEELCSSDRRSVTDQTCGNSCSNGSGSTNNNGEELCRQGVILLLNGNPRGFEQLAYENRLLPDTLAERINELLYDSVGDIVLQQSGGGYAVIDDYRTETEEFAYG